MRIRPTQLLTGCALISSLVISIASAPVQASKIYRWTDENGQMHFSENPPRGIEVETVKVKVRSGTGVGAATSSTPSTTSRPSTKTAQKPTEEKEGLTTEYSKEDKAKYCQQSRDLLTQMQGNPNRRFKQEDGSYQKLTEEQRADYVAQAQDGIERFCQ